MAEAFSCHSATPQPSAPRSRLCSPMMSRRQALRRVAYAHSRSMTWERTAERYLAAFETALGRHASLDHARSDTSTLLRDQAARRLEMRLVSFSVDV